MIVYDGPSMLNGKPILAIITINSSNRKTGPMSQLYILPRRVNPVTAIRTGYDRAVCGNCPLRRGAGGSCYVNVGHAPRRVWNSWRSGKYGKGLQAGRAWRHVGLRVGAYGDPAALPYDVVANLARSFGGRHTGYTHQWKTCDQRLARLLMASVEDSDGMRMAHSMGWRTFRVMGRHDEITAGERMCANVTHGTKCADCMACRGTRGLPNAANIAIRVHGSLAGRFDHETVPG